MSAKNSNSDFIFKTYSMLKLSSIIIITTIGNSNGNRTINKLKITVIITIVSAVSLSLSLSQTHTRRVKKIWNIDLISLSIAFLCGHWIIGLLTCASATIDQCVCIKSTITVWPSQKQTKNEEIWLKGRVTETVRVQYS